MPPIAAGTVVTELRKPMKHRSVSRLLCPAVVLLSSTAFAHPGHESAAAGPLHDFPAAALLAVALTVACTIISAARYRNRNFP